jgi:hypothetical protein
MDMFTPMATIIEVDKLTATGAPDLREGCKITPLDCKMKPLWKLLGLLPSRSRVFRVTSITIYANDARTVLAYHHDAPTTQTLS